jgi:hypothetical protein
VKPGLSTNMTPCEWLQTLFDCLANRTRLPDHLNKAPHQDATLELERQLEREIARRLGRRHPRATT